MKHYLEDIYDDYKSKSNDMQRERIWEAWHVIATPGFLREAIEGIIV